MDKTRLLGVGTLAVLFVAVTGNTVLVGQAGTISACYHSITGNLRVVAAGTQCLPHESPLVWSVQGVSGPKGEQGPEGPQGPAGNTNVFTNKLINAVPVNEFQTTDIPGFGTLQMICLSSGRPELNVFSPGAYQLHRRNVDDATAFSQVVNAGTGFLPVINNPPGPSGRSIDTVWISAGTAVWKLDYLTRQRDLTVPCIVAVTVTVI